MKTQLALNALLLLFDHSLLSQQLTVTNNQMRSVGFPQDSVVQVYGSYDMKSWRPRLEFAANSSALLSSTNRFEFYRARIKPPAAIVQVTSPMVSTGRLYQIKGTASATLVDLRYGTNRGRLTGRPSLDLVEWEFPTLKFSLGTNRMALSFRDVNNNSITTNISVLLIAGPFLVIEHPQPEAAVVGDTGVLIGRVDDLKAKVTVNGTNAPVSEDGHFYCVGLPLSATNEWVVRSGTESVTVRFYQSPVRVTYSVSMDHSFGPSSPLPFTVNGTISDTNYTLHVGEKHIIPNANGTWKYKGVPPRKGILPITLTPRGSQASSSASGAITINYVDSWYITSHRYFYRYEFTQVGDLDDHWKQFSGSFSKNGDTAFSMLKYRYYSNPDLCSADYSGYWPYLFWVSDVGDCSNPSWRIYPAEAVLAQYSDGFQGMFWETDALTYTADSAAQLYTGGTPGGNSTVKLAITLLLTQITRDGTTGDEITESTTTNMVPVGYLGGISMDGTGTIYVNTYEGVYIDVTPSLNAMNNIWVEYDFSMVRL